MKVQVEADTAMAARVVLAFATIALSMMGLISTWWTLEMHGTHEETGFSQTLVKADVRPFSQGEFDSSLVRLVRAVSDDLESEVKTTGMLYAFALTGAALFVGADLWAIAGRNMPKVRLALAALAVGFGFAALVHAHSTWPDGWSSPYLNTELGWDDSRVTPFEFGGEQATLRLETRPMFGYYLAMIGTVVTPALALGIGLLPQHWLAPSKTVAAPAPPPSSAAPTTPAPPGASPPGAVQAPPPAAPSWRPTGAASRSDQALYPNSQAAPRAPPATDAHWQRPKKPGEKDGG